MTNPDKFANDDELHHEIDYGRSFQKNPSMNLYKERSSLDQHRPLPENEDDGYSAVKYYSTYQEPGKQVHAKHGSAGDLSALDQVEDPQRVNKLLSRPQATTVKPFRSDIEEQLANDPNATTSTSTTTSYSVKNN